MSKNLVKSELKNKIFFLELNNPQSQNTLSEKMIEELTENFKLASKNEPEVKKPIAPTIAITNPIAEALPIAFFIG